MPNREDIESVCAAAGRAFAALSDMGCVARAGLLDGLAAALDARRDEVLRTACDETALTVEELTPEFARMTGTLRMFAELVREGSWVRAAVDTRQTQGLVGPNHDIRSMLVPLGPVAVFGSSNFPLAYGVCGGDTASALAAGCPVVVKEHPAHPRTGRLLAEIAHAAASAAGFAGQLVGYLPNEDPRDYSIAEALVRHPVIAAVGFTGSTRGGLALEKLARERESPVPVFAEMGSANRVVICRHALKNRGAAIAAELAQSIVARHGQQCTKPGLIGLWQDRAAGPAFVAELARLLDAAAARRMLSSRIADEYIERCQRLRSVPNLSIATNRKEPEVVSGAERLTAPMLFAALEFDQARACLDALQMFTSESRGYWLNDEIFGPAAVVFGDDGWENFWYAHPSLATTVYADPDDMGDLLIPNEDAAPEVAHGLKTLIATTGRLIFNGVPTGVRVATAMVHGGPIPATNRPDITAVGPRAIERWCRPVCWQNCPDGLLPEELRDANPRGVMRVVNGVWTRDGVARP